MNAISPWCLALETLIGLKWQHFCFKEKNEDKTGYKSLSVTVTSPNKSSLKCSVWNLKAFC